MSEATRDDPETYGVTHPLRKSRNRKAEAARRTREAGARKMRPRYPFLGRPGWTAAEILEAGQKLRARKIITGRFIISEPYGSPTIPEVRSFDSDRSGRAEPVSYCLTSPNCCFSAGTTPGGRLDDS